LRTHPTTLTPSLSGALICSRPQSGEDCHGITPSQGPRGLLDTRAVSV
jgi:hypothetical protein